MMIPMVEHDAPQKGQPGQGQERASTLNDSKHAPHAAVVDCRKLLPNVRGRPVERIEHFAKRFRLRPAGGKVRRGRFIRLR